MAHSIRCVDCGAERTARNRNTRYCHHCRLLRNMEHYSDAGSLRTCAHATCETKFAPVDNHKADEYCGPHTLGYTALRGTCVACKTERAYLVRAGVAICNTCAREPKLRRKLIDAMRRGQDERTHANQKEA